MSHISLVELNNKITQALSAQLDMSYWVVTEIGEMRLTQRGHCYLELVEKDQQKTLAKMRATLWSYQYRRLSGWFTAITGQDIKAGMKIRCQVEVVNHAVYGLSLNIKDIDANYTLGERARKKQEVIKRLEKDGVFDMNMSLPLPVVPQRIAIISSPTAAGLGDFMDQINNNKGNYKFDMQLFKAVMQGDQAAASINDALMRVFGALDQKAFDLVVLIRGGGGQLDLDCFDSYELASHIAQFPIPIFTGIGHERDDTVADMVAHTKLKTPTAVAEFLINGCSDFEYQLDQLWQSISRTTQQSLTKQDFYLNELQNEIKYLVSQKLGRQQSKLNEIGHKIKLLSIQCIHLEDNKLTTINDSMKKLSLRVLSDEMQRINQLEKLVSALDPDKILKKGFSYSTINGKPIGTLDAIEVGDVLVTRTHKQLIASNIEEVKKIDNEEEKSR